MLHVSALSWTGGFWDQHKDMGAAQPHCIPSWQHPHTAEVGRATTSSLQHELFPVERTGRKGRVRWRWPDRLQRWRCAEQNRSTHYPIPDSQHTGSLLWLDGRKHLARIKQVRLVQNNTIKKLALDEISRYTGLCQAITMQRTITILTSSLHFWSQSQKLSYNVSSFLSISILWTLTFVQRMSRNPKKPDNVMPLGLWNTCKICIWQQARKTLDYENL